MTTSVFVHQPTDSALWLHLVECWSRGFDYDQSVSYEFTFTRRLFDVAMQACDDDFDTYLYSNDRETWRKGHNLLKDQHDRISDIPISKDHPFVMFRPQAE